MDHMLTCNRKENKKMIKAISRFFRDEEGQDMIEYSLLAAFISIIAIVTIKLIGPLVETIYKDIKTALTP